MSRRMRAVDAEDSCAGVGEEEAGEGTGGKAGEFEDAEGGERWWGGGRGCCGGRVGRTWRVGVNGCNKRR